MRKTVIIVEDEKISSLFLEDLVGRLGYQVADTAVSGEEAVRKAGALRPDLVIMDMGLKGGMNGAEAASIIDERYGIPILFITAYTQNEMQRYDRLPGNYGLLSKPIVEQELEREVKHILSGS